jgi:transposase-like protein
LWPKPNFYKRRIAVKSNGELSSQQLEAIVCLAENPNISIASKKAGVSRSTLHRWLNNPDFKAALEKAKREQFLLAQEQIRSLVPLAVEGLKELAQSSKEQIRLRACTEILKATRAYGATVSPLPFTLEDIPLEVFSDYSGKLTLQMLEKIMSGELPASTANTLLQVLNKLEEIGERTYSKLGRHKVGQSDENIKKVLSTLTDDELDLFERVAEKFQAIEKTPIIAPDPPKFERPAPVPNVKREEEPEPEDEDDSPSTEMVRTKPPRGHNKVRPVSSQVIPGGGRGR